MGHTSSATNPGLVFLTTIVAELRSLLEHPEGLRCRTAHPSRMSHVPVAILQG